MQAVFGLPGEVELFILGFVALKIALIALIILFVTKRFPALARGLRRGVSELKDGFDQGMRQ